MHNAEFLRQWALELHLTRAQCTLQEALLKRYSFGVNDGSFKDEVGLAAWIIEGPNTATNLLVNGIHPVNLLTTVLFKASWQG